MNINESLLIAKGAEMNPYTIVAVLLVGCGLLYGEFFFRSLGLGRFGDEILFIYFMCAATPLDVADGKIADNNGGILRKHGGKTGEELKA